MAFVAIIGGASIRHGAFIRGGRLNTNFTSQWAVYLRYEAFIWEWAFIGSFTVNQNIFVSFDYQIAMYLQDNLELVTNYKSLVKVMELIAESNVKSSEMNEVLAMKMHYLACVLKICARWHEELDGKGGIDGFIK